MSVIEKDGPYAWFYLAVTAVACFLFIGLIDSTGIVVAVFIAHYNESNAKGGWVGSIVFFLLYAFAPIVVYMHSRIGFRWCMLICSFLCGFSFILTPFVPNIEFVYLTYSIPIGISLSFISTLSVITLREYFSKFFGFAIGIRYGAGALGAAVISLILPFVFDGIGVKPAFFSMLSFLPIMLSYGLVSRHHLTDTRLHRNKKSTKDIYWEFVHDRSFTICLAGILLYMMSCTIPTIFMVRYGITLGYPLSMSKWFLVVKASTMLLATILVGHMNDRILRNGKVRQVSQTACVIFSLCSLLCSFISSFPLLMVYSALIGLVDGAWWATYPILIVEITSGYHSNEAYGFINLLVAFARLSSPPCLGWLFDITGDFRYVLYAIFAIPMIAAILFAVSSRVKVEKHFSLAEKNGIRKIDLDCSGEGELSCCFFDNLVISRSIIYETTV